MLAFLVKKRYNKNNRGVAQPGRVLALGARCRWFKSSRPDHLYNIVCLCILCYFFEVFSYIFALIGIIEENCCNSS